jgi:hypothetical protein
MKVPKFHVLSVVVVSHHQGADGGWYEEPKNFVEDKWMHCVSSVVFILIIKSDIDLQAQRDEGTKISCFISCGYQPSSGGWWWLIRRAEKFCRRWMNALRSKCCVHSANKIRHWLASTTGWRYQIPCFISCGYHHLIWYVSFMMKSLQLDMPHLVAYATLYSIWIVRHPSCSSSAHFSIVL